MFQPRGVFGAMLTPFDDSGRINEAELRRYVDYLIDGGLNGLFPVTSVGESIHLEAADKMRLMDIVVDQAAGRVPVTPGSGDINSASAARLATHAQGLGCPAVVVPPPHFFPVSDEVMETYFRDIDRAVDIGLIVYNIPLFSTPISREVFSRLCGDIKLVGMKDSSGSLVDFIHYLDLTRQAGAEVNMLTGREEALFGCLTVGGKGCMTATAAIMPRVMSAIFRAWLAGEMDKALELQYSVLPLVRACFSIQFPLGFKIALAARGFEMGAPRQGLDLGAGSDYERAKADIIAALAYADEKSAPWLD